MISQIKKYDLTKAFKDVEKFEEWIVKLNKKQIKNFNSLVISPNEIKFPKELLINDNLLDCNDYTKRIDAMLKLQSDDDCWNLFDRLCAPNFLNSKKYYEDMEIISKANTARYALIVINNDNFINSKYHDEDLKLIIEATNEKKDNGTQNYRLVAEVLSMVATDLDSINSPYHQKDMDLIAHCNSNCLQGTGLYPKSSLNNLATNKVSLNDKYHLENMQILAQNPIASQFLYNIMTDKDIIKNEYYRNEIDALKNAKNKLKARAIYYYITNPNRMRNDDFNQDLYDRGLNYFDINLLNENNNVKGNLNPHYITYLKLLNEIDDKFVMHFESFLSNKNLFNSPYQEYDINILLTITNKNIFMDLFQLMTNSNSLSKPHHKADIELISKTMNNEKRRLLLKKATNKDSINSIYHRYDMAYIAKLNLDIIEEKIYNNGMYYYLFTGNGINDKEHIAELEKLYRGDLIEKKDNVLDYLNSLEEELSKEVWNIKINNKVLSKSKKDIFQRR